MRTFRTAALLLFGIPATVAASEELAYSAVYECNAVAITKAMVRVCSSLKPSLAERSAIAYSKWLRRNSDKADAREGECSAELRARGDTEESRLQVMELRQQMKQLEREMIRGFEAKVASEGFAACDEALSQLETGRGGVDLR